MFHSQWLGQHIRTMMISLYFCSTVYRLNFPIEGGTTRILQRPLELNGYEVPKGVGTSDPSPNRIHFQ